MTKEANQPGTGVLIESPEQLGFLVTEWHRERCHHLTSLMDAPADLDITVSFDGETEETLNSERERQLFKLGVEYALNQFLQLPFVPAMEEADETNPENSGDGSEL